MKLSIVSTLYYSAQYIEEFCERSAKAAREFAGEDFEIVLVNDGSPDNSLAVAVRLYESGRFPLKIVDFSRNFGHHKAMMAGCMNASGDYVFLIDVDLEESPEWLQPFAEQLQQDDCDVVYGVQDQRKGGWFERISGKIFYSLFNFLAEIKVPRNITTARLMTRRYVDVLTQYQEREIFMLGLWTIAGFKQEPRTVHKLSTSPTTYTFRKKILLLWNSILSFSTKPLHFICYLGLFFIVFSFLYSLAIFLQYFLQHKHISGWTSLIISVWFLGGITIFSLGLIGFYLSKVFMEVKMRPYVTCRHIYQHKEREKECGKN
ncbi:MAG: glycosyltransferase family 2 protein [Lentisphaeria bacterium]|nr:glycosyltransferase family 2 protein [Lentisphaeria bacterium]